MSTVTDGRRIALSAPKLRVVLGDWDDESTWTELEVQTFQPDMVAAEELLKRNGIPTFNDSPITAQAAIAYFALKRRRHDDAHAWDDFLARLLETSQVEDQVVEDPTSPAATSGP